MSKKRCDGGADSMCMQFRVVERLGVEETDGLVHFRTWFYPQRRDLRSRLWGLMSRRWSKWGYLAGPTWSHVGMLRLRFPTLDEAWAYVKLQRFGGSEEIHEEAWGAWSGRTWSDDQS